MFSRQPREVVSRDPLFAIEPAFRSFAHRTVGGTYAPDDESGDGLLFIQQLAHLCAARGVQFFYGHDVERLEVTGGAVQAAALRDRATGERQRLGADAVVVACGAYSATLLRGVGVDLPIHPGKGYSATFKLRKPEQALLVSAIDERSSAP